MKSMMKRCLTFFMAVAMIVTFAPAMPAYAADSTHDSKITLTKTATDNGEAAGSQTFTVNLGVTGETVEEAAPIDVTLVIDLSNSMDDNNNANLNATKAAATAFIQNMMMKRQGGTYVDVEDCKVRVSLVAYGSHAYAYDFASTNNKRLYEYSSLSRATGFYTYSGQEALRVINSNGFSNQGSLLTQAYGNETGGTNTEGGLLAAQYVTATRARNANLYDSNASSYVLFMTDGVPTRRYNDDFDSVNDGSGTSTSEAEFNETVVAANNLKNAGNTIYTIGLISGLDNDEKAIADYLLSDEYSYMRNDNAQVGTKTETVECTESHDHAAANEERRTRWVGRWPNRYQQVYYMKEVQVPTYGTAYETNGDPYSVGYYSVTNTNNITSAMNDIYNGLAVQLKNLATGTVTDVIPADFELTAASKTSLEAAGCTIRENTDGTTTIVFPNVLAGATTYNLPAYTIKYTGNGYGVAYTNTEATFTYTDYEGNTGSKAFPKPIAPVCPITADDTSVAKVNTATVIDITENDAFEKMETIGSYTVGDYTIILTDKDGNAVPSYNGFTVGSINAATGEVTFTSETEGTYEFYYVIQAEIENTDSNFAINGRTTVKSNPTKVTVDVVNAQDKAFVVDYYKPVTYNSSDVFTATELAAGNTRAIANGTGLFGTMSMATNSDVTYTMTSIMKGIDPFEISETIKGLDFTKKVVMIPATSVYYNDSFADNEVTTDVYGVETTNRIRYSAGWETVGETDASRAFQDAAQGVSTNYGYDSSEAYIGNSAGTVKKLSANRSSADTLMVTFTGTGLDIYSTTDTNSGTIAARLYDENGNNLYLNEVTDASYESGTLLNMPTITYKDLTYGTYTVKLYIPDDTAFEFDGIRIYNPAQGDETAEAKYAADDEANAKMQYLRDVLLGETGVVGAASGSVYIDEYVDIDGNDVAAHNVTVSSADDTTAAYAEFETFGPKEAETYLAAGQSITVTGLNGYNVQLGIKASVSGAAYTINNGTAQTVTSSTDMYYDITLNENHSFTITNTSNVMIELTGMKLIPNIER